MGETGLLQFPAGDAEELYRDDPCIDDVTYLAWTRMSGGTRRAGLVGLVVMACGAWAQSAWGLSFAPAAGSPLAAGTAPGSMAVSDFNRDGTPDLAVANFTSNSVSVLLGTGAGGFTPAGGSPFAAGTFVRGVAVGDFNADGKPDIAISNVLDGTVTVLLGDGSGGFTPASGSPVATGNAPRSMAVGDFNGDGKPDLAVTNEFMNAVTVLLGDGAGGFTPASGSPFATGTSPASVAVGDFNGDGKPDLAIANSMDGTVTVLSGTGAGGFTPASGSPFATGISPASVVVGDFNGDGKPDLAVANSGSNDVTVLLGNGLRGFTPATGSPFAAGISPASVAVGDFDGDGKPDLAIADPSGNDVTVLSGNGSGGFTPATGSPFAAGISPASVAVADFSGDGKPDLAIANSGSNNVTVLVNTSAPAIGSSAIAAFVAQPQNTLSAPQTLTITNTGSMPLRLADLTLGGTDPSDFFLANDACSQHTLAEMTSCTTSVYFAPTAQGSRSAQISIPGNVTSPNLVSLSGSAGPLPPGPPGPTGAAGAGGTNGSDGFEGAIGPDGPASPQGPIGPRGAAGPAGRRGARGQIELMSCTTTTTTTAVHGQKTSVVRQVCTTKLISSPTKFTAKASRATLSRGRVIYARGTASASRLRLRSHRVLRAGRYTLTLTSNHKTTRQAITIS
jgi:hypothetical protein